MHDVPTDTKVQLRRLVILYEPEAACRDRLMAHGATAEVAGEIAFYLAQATDFAALVEPVTAAFAAVGVQLKVVVKGLAAVVPDAGVNVEPAGAPVALNTRLPMLVEPVTIVLNGVPTGTTKVPDPTHVGGGWLTIWTMRSTCVELVWPLWVDSTT